LNNRPGKAQRSGIEKAIFYNPLCEEEEGEMPNFNSKREDPGEGAFD
jgi:hypothetical protein